LRSTRRLLVARKLHEIRAAEVTRNEKAMQKRRFGHIRQLPSGRWQASYTGLDGQRYRAPHTFSTKKAAEKWVRYEEALIETNQWMEERAKITPLFGEYCTEFIETQTTRTGELLKPTTKQLYRTLLRVHLEPFHDIPLHEIDAPRIREWWATAIADGKRTSRSRAYKLLSATMRRAVSDRLIPYTPCTIEGAHTAETGKKLVVPSAEEVQRIIQNMNPRYKTFTVFLANSGLRFGEAAALERSDLTMDALRGQPAWKVSVTKTAALVNGTITTQAPKSKASVRTIKLRPEMTVELAQHMRAQADRNTTLLFPNASDGYIRNDVYTNSFRRALKKAGVDPRVTPHSLRHFAGSEYGRTGANVAELSTYLGDKSKSAVLRYLHTTDRGDDLLDGMRFVG
jgi:integrase